MFYRCHSFYVRDVIYSKKNHHKQLQKASDSLNNSSNVLYMAINSLCILIKENTFQNLISINANVIIMKEESCKVDVRLNLK